MVRSWRVCACTLGLGFVVFSIVLAGGSVALAPSLAFGMGGAGGGDGGIGGDRAGEGSRKWLGSNASSAVDLQSRAKAKAAAPAPDRPAVDEKSSDKAEGHGVPLSTD